VLDNLDRTVVAAENAGDAPGVLDGARMVRAQLDRVLRGYGLERLDAREAVFDPAIHDAVGTLPVSSPALHETVLDQVAPGYRFAGSLLRPARVVVGLRRQ
jgi:molecular chaperone GrpE